ncbi:MAG: GbsR/MarR family transcriptional regulator [Candidatus Limnocylindria bacterium]
MSSTFASPSAAEGLRRSFAAAWGEIGGAWGIAPSTASVQGYLLVSDGPLSEPEVRRALGMSHRAASLALAQCEAWGLIERADAPRRSGQRGPAAVAWSVVDDNWEWFRRVAAARKERETDPVMPVIERCTRQALDAAGNGADEELTRLGERLGGLLEFVQRFDRGVEVFVQGDARAIEDVFATLDRMDPATVRHLWRLVGELGPEDLGRALDALSRLPAPAARRLIGLADQPALQRLIGLR